MPVIVRENETTAVSQDGGVVARLLTAEIIGNDQIELDHVAVAADGRFEIALDAGMVGWLQVLEGAGTLNDNTLDTKHITYLPFGFTGAFQAGGADSRILFARVPDAARFDDDIADMPGELVHVDWTREPVLQSEHDARTRVYMATPGLAGTKAFKGEMISYPPGTAAPEHHHVGAEHFQYVVAGEGTAMLDGTAHRLRAGDVLYNYQNEPHAFINETDSDFVFVEFFVPGPCETVWSPGANLCAWLPTGVDSDGNKPVRDIGYHVHGQDGGI
ncbi:MAG: cupin domain-containing protein [Alphaproteobacteria bacterium]